MKRVYEIMKADLAELRQSPPGRRFVRFHDCRRDHRLQEGALRRVAYITLAIVLIVVGTAIGVLPIGVPGILLVVVGLAILVVRSLTLARVLDRSELWLRRQGRRFRRTRAP